MEKIYAGNGKKQSGKFGDFTKISICLTDLPKEHIRESNGKKYINLIVSDRKEADKNGNTLSVTVDTWKPDPNKKNEPAQIANAPKVTPIDEGLDDLPF